MDLFPLLLYFFITIPSAIFHEYMHGWVADQLGDPTARYAGRLTLNPRPHIDPIGTIVMPLLLFFLTRGAFMFAYAKPVPYNPYNLKNQRWGSVAVAVAGPLANFALAFVFGLAWQFSNNELLRQIFGIIVLVNTVLGVFNCVPIPPLDGSKVLYALLPASADRLRNFLDRFGFIILLFFIFQFFWILSPIIDFLTRWFTGSLAIF